MKLDVRKRNVVSPLTLKAGRQSYLLIVFRHGEADVQTEKKDFVCNTEELVLVKPGCTTQIRNRDTKTEIATVSIPVQILEEVSN